MFNILKEDLKNTRFILTCIAMAELVFSIILICGLAAITMIYKVDISQTFIALLSTALGVLFGLIPLSYNWYFKDRQTNEVTALEVVNNAT